ncbi:2Fe-2S iron-sulfur cluster-binding protein [Bradyrhizobium genosp. P]|uniref:2Fe-2S iron-sulfur cluster-binding protein n=1 Tax=Bradyrhizobium genosp. P TaxID=83641 RepID=UPI003CEE8FB5
MVKITYVEHSGLMHVIEVDLGQTVMEGAIANRVPGIDADCGGNCACGTCHVYVDEDWLGATGERSEAESKMLEFADGVENNSRLSCQIKVTPALDGLLVAMPESQQ